MNKLLISAVLSLILAWPVAAHVLPDGTREETREASRGIMQEVEESREDLQDAIREKRENLRRESEEVKEETQNQISEVRENMRSFNGEEGGALKTQVRELRDEALRQYREKRAELKSQLEQSREAFKEAVATKRVEMENLRETKRVEFKERLRSIKDEQKKKIVEKIDQQLTELNERLLNHFAQVLEKLENALTNISSRADKAEAHDRDVSVVRIAIDNANSAIAASRSSIELQSGKVYTPIVNTEEMLRLDVGKARQALHADLVAVRETVKAAHDAVKEAAITLAQIPQIDELEVEEAEATVPSAESGKVENSEGESSNN